MNNILWNNMRLLITGLLLIFFFVFVPLPALADAGVPMLFITFPLILTALLPVIAIETFVFFKRGFPFKPSLTGNVVANVVSTIVGIPLTWGLLVFLELISGGGSAYGLDSLTKKILAVTWQSPWLIPYEGDLKWMIPIAMLVLFVPFFGASYFIESRINRLIMKQWPREKVYFSSFLANVISYSLLAIFPVVILVFPNVLESSSIFSFVGIK